MPDTNTETETQQPPTTTEACQFCGFDRFTKITMSEHHVMEYALKCGRCDGFKSWQPKPPVFQATSNSSGKSDKFNKSKVSSMVGSENNGI